MNDKPNQAAFRHIWPEPLARDEQLWRYFSTERILWFLEHSLLHFAAATQFIDPFEGAVAVQSPDLPMDPRYAEMEFGEKAFQELKRLTKVSCWHRADYESDAMWKLYADQSKGVAVCSTPERMETAFRPFRLSPEYGAEDIWCGAVRYQDLMKVRMETGMMKRFFFKHQAFAWEREFRLAISVRSAEEFGVKVPELGILVSVDSGALIERVMLGPALSQADRSAITECARKAGLGDRIVQSSLLGRPRYV